MKQGLIPIVTAQEMARLERLAIQDGCQEKLFMREAGQQVASAAFACIKKHKLPKRVTLLIGKGNNGGDAYVAGISLLKQGVAVQAWPLAPPSACSPLNQFFGAKFRKAGGVTVPLGRTPSLQDTGLILDGLLGTGFQGAVQGKLASIIEQANASSRPILAIDIPSGLNGTTGETQGPAIRAHLTLALGFPKSGLFLREGWNFSGRIEVKNFGIPDKFFALANAFAYMADPTDSKGPLLPSIIRNRHKYQAGYVVGYAGSSRFKGAPKLSALAALRMGAGIVQVFHEGEIGPTPPELICQPWEKKMWQQELQRAHALFIGPGIGRSTKITAFLKKELKTLRLPTVLDADALQPEVDFPKHTILTPHRGEMLRLLGHKKTDLGWKDDKWLAQCQAFAKQKQIVLILKGAPTWIFSQDQLPIAIPFGDPGMATAGTGDVLTGILAALLAQNMNCLDAALVGTTLHALAGEAAAREKTSYGVIATDLIDCLPQAIRTYAQTTSLML